MADMLFKTDDFIFSYRVGGILIRDGKVLLQRAAGDDGYAFVGGHVSFGETTDETLVREFREEINANIKIDRLLMVGENFFQWGRRPCQQINLYYLVSLAGEPTIPLDGIFHATDELGEERIDLDMCWVPLADIPSVKLYPAEAKEHLLRIPDGIVYFAHRE